MIDDKKKRNQILGVLFLGVLMGALDIAIVGPALPAIQDGFAIDSRASAWIFTIFVLFNLMGSPLMAKLSDRFGRRNVYILDISLFAFGSLMVAIAPRFGVLLAGRAIQGFGVGGIFPVAAAVIADTFPEENRGKALGITGAVFGLAFLLGPILAGVILKFANWNWLFLINLPIAVYLIIQGFRLLPTDKPDDVRPFDIAGIISLSVLLASLTLGLNAIDSSHLWASLSSLQVYPYLLVAIVLIPIFWKIENSAQDPILRPGLLGSSQVKLASLFSIGAGLIEAAMVFIPALAIALFQIEKSTASFMLLPLILALAFGAPTAGRMLDRVGVKPVIFTGLLLLAIGLLLFGFTASNIVMFYVSGALVGLGLSSLLGAPLRYLMLAEAGKDERAASQGLLTIFTSTGQLVGGALIGAIAASSLVPANGYQKAIMVLGFISLAMLPFALLLKGKES